MPPLSTPSARASDHPPHPRPGRSGAQHEECSAVGPRLAEQLIERPRGGVRESDGSHHKASTRRERRAASADALSGQTAGLRMRNAGPVARYLVGGAGALGVTLSLFLLMQGLISVTDNALSQGAGGRVIEFVRLKRQSELQVRERQLPQAPRPQPQPTTPAMSVTDTNTVTNAASIPVSALAPPNVPHTVALSGGPQLGSMAAATADADVVPLVRVQPLYPRRAAERRIEGWVLVQFDIDERGEVKDPQVIDAEPHNVFERDALRAIRKWKYKPKIEGGVAKARRAVQVKLTFSLEDLQ